MYCSLAEARSELKSSSTVDDKQVLRYIRQVSARIDGLLNPGARRPYFAPYVETRRFPIDPGHVDSLRGVFRLTDPLLALTTAVAAGTDITALVEGYPPASSPIRALWFLNSGYDWYSYCSSSGRRPEFLAVTGLWGFHRNYAGAWVTIDNVTTTAVTPSATSFTVADVDGADPDGFSPRLSAGHLIRFGSASEINEVTGTTGTNTAQMRRAVNGSSAPSADYAIGTAVQVWQTEDVIRRVVARQAALMYARQGAFQVETLDGVGSISYPQDLLTELSSVLNEYQYL
jgi:hypothetical protein